MTTQVLAASPDRPKYWPAIAQAWLVAGVLDITYVLVVYGIRGVSSIRLLQGVAFSILGRTTYDGGWATAGLGLALHFCVAFSVTAVFFAISRRLTFLVRNPFLWGPLYGVGVFLVMNLVVVPLTLIGWRPFTLVGVVLNVIPLMFCVGLPLALILRRFAR